MPTVTTVLPAQVSPPAFALSELEPHELSGVEVIALPFTVADAQPVLGVGASEVGDALGLDLAGLLTSRKAAGKGGEVVTVPVARSRPRTSAEPPGSRFRLRSGPRTGRRAPALR